MNRDLSRTTLVALLVLLVSAFHSVMAQVVISEVDPATGTFELHNTGDSEVDVSSVVVCNRPAYAPMSDLEVVSGSLVIPAGGYLVAVWDAIAAGEAEFGIYSDNRFSNADSLIDYIEWGSAGHGREGVAETAGLWTAGTFIAPPGEGQTIAMTGSAMDGDPVDNWSAGAPTLGAANTAE
ncbi:MAG: hypothetical protein JSV66_18255 [Trueperaceae bacterium]|nr:MAG: hypothetical protein JSV66_18255 [Trueperaceae bacterium]